MRHSAVLMTYSEFFNLIKGRLEALPFEKQLHFTLQISKALFEYYSAFARRYELSGEDTIIDAIRLAERDPLFKEDIQRMIPLVDSLAPDSDDYVDCYGALNCCCAVVDMLQFLLSRDPELLHNIATYYYDTLDAQIQENQDLSEEQIETHPILQEGKSYLIQITQS